MKPQFTITDRILYALFAGCLIAIISTSQCGCRNLAPNGVYHGEKVLYESENTITASYELVHTFLAWEEANRASLTTMPAITRGADKLRVEYPKAYDTANALRDAYVAAPGPDTEAPLKPALAVLRAALAEAAQYMAQATQPPK